MKKILYAASLVLSFPIVSHAQWVVENSGFSTPNLGIWSIAALNANDVWATAFDTSGTNPVRDFTRTTNGGATWTPGQINGANNWDITSITATSNTTAWVSMGDPANGGGRIYKTTNGGANWSQQNNAAFASPAGWADMVCFWDANNGVCIGDSNTGYWEIYTTTNGGTNWTRVGQANIPANLATETGNDNTYSAVGNTIWFGTGMGRVYKSTDKGLTWSVSQTGLPNITSIAFKDANNGLVENGGSLQKTTDGGSTWVNVTATGNVRDGWMCYAQGAPGAYVTTEYNLGTGGSSYSLDDGATWIDMDNNVDHGAVAFINTALGWSGGINANATTAGMFKWTGSMSVSPIDPANFDVAIFPNPFTASATLTIRSNFNAQMPPLTFKMYDMFGRMINQHTIAGTRSEITREALPSGVYFYQVNSSEKIIASGKLVVQ